jgi:hypothetical protein
MATINSAINQHSDSFFANKDRMCELVSELNATISQVKQAGEEARKKHVARGKLCGEIWWT